MPLDLTRTSLLVLIKEKSDHGYSLHKRLMATGVTTPISTGALYRCLRKMESDEFLVTTWNTPKAGPASRVYSLTSTGEQELKEQVDLVQREVLGLRRILNIYRSC